MPEIYNTVFTEYPDLLNVEQLSQILEVSTKTAYKLLNEKKITSLKVGRQIKIPKIHVLKYLNILPDDAI